MAQLHEDYFKVDVRQSHDTHQYFELLYDVVEEKRKILEYAIQNDIEHEKDEPLYAELEDLLESVREQVKSEQEKKSKLKAAETAEEEIQAEKDAEEKEILCVDLIELTKRLVNASGTVGKRLVSGLDLVRRYFEDYLFASHYSQSAGVNAAAQAEAGRNEVIEQSGSRAGDKKKSIVSSEKSRKAAFDLLIEFMGDDKDVLEKFIN